MYELLFVFESIRFPTEELKETQTTTWIGNHVLISVSISSNLTNKPIFLYNEDSQKLLNDFVSKLEAADENKISRY